MIKLELPQCMRHMLTWCRDHYTPLDDTAIPTGEIAPVAGTPFDFTEAHPIRESVKQVHGGIDHNFVLFGMGRQAKFIVKAGAASNTCAPAALFSWRPKTLSLRPWSILQLAKREPLQCSSAHGLVCMHACLHGTWPQLT